MQKNGESLEELITRDVLCVVLCVVLIIELLPTQSVLRVRCYDCTLGYSTNRRYVRVPLMAHFGVLF